MSRKKGAEVIVTPRYGEPPVLDSEHIIGDPSGPLIRQRRRLADILATLDAEQWAEPSRCELWPVRDVVAHSWASTNCG